MSLLSIPLDAWVVILRHVDERDIVRAFSRIYASGALGVPPFRKLDAFWLVVTQARLHEREAEAASERHARRGLRFGGRRPALAIFCKKGIWLLERSTALYLWYIGPVYSLPPTSSSTIISE